MSEIQMRSEAMVTREEMLLNRAMALMGDVHAYERAFLSKSPEAQELLKGQQEQGLNYKQIQENRFFSRSLLPENAHPDDAAVNPDATDSKGRPQRFNTNMISKLSNNAVIGTRALVMLAGTDLDGTGDPSPEGSGVSKDVMIAAAIFDSVGKRTRLRSDLERSDLPPLDPKQFVTVDEAYIRQQFGDAVWQNVEGIRRGLKQLEQAMPFDPPLTPDQANAIAAISAARVSEAAKVVSLRLYHRLPDEAQEAFRKENKLEGVSDPESVLLQAELGKLNRILVSQKLDASITVPIKEVLVPSVTDYLEGKADRESLWGKEDDGRGCAYGAFNRAQKIYLHVPDPENMGFHDVVKAMLFIARHQQDSTRKDGTGILTHSLTVAGHGTRSLDDQHRAKVTIVELLHDWVEDGGKEVANKNANLQAILEEFGLETALLVAEMTDENSESHYKRRAEDARNGETRKHTFVEQVIASYKEQAGITGSRMPRISDDRFEELTQKYLEETPFSLTTAGPKLMDVLETALKNVEEPQANAGYWKNSGIRIGWFVNSKGYVTRDLYSMVTENMSIFFDKNDDNKFDAERKTPSGHNEGELQRGLLNVMAITKKGFDQFTLQNLVILADEFGLDANQQRQFVQAFVNRDVDLKTYMDGNLLDKNFMPKKLDQSTLYAKDAQPGDPRNYENILAMRKLFLDRETQRDIILVSAKLSANAPAREEIERTTGQTGFHGDV